MRWIVIFLMTSSFGSFWQSANCQHQNLSFNHLTANEGLSAGVNNYIFKDSKGYVWISSFDGLNKFDGTDIEVFKDVIGDSNSIKGTLFLNILEDGNNNLWVGGNEGLNFYDRKRNHFKCSINSENNTTNQTYSPFYIDNKNNVWVQSGQSILLFNIYTRKFKKLYEFSAYGNLIVKFSPRNQLQTLRTIAVAIRGSSLMFTSTANEDALFFKQLNVLHNKASLSINAFSVMDSTYWIGTTTGLYRYVSGKLNKIHIETESTSVPSISVIYLDEKNSIWAGSQKDGVFFIDEKEYQKPKQFMHSMYNPNSLSGNQIQYIYTDGADNNLWISVWGKGIDYVNLNKFKFEHYLTQQEAEKEHVNNFIRSIIEVSNNQFWCGTQLNGILVLNSEKKIIKKITSSLPPSIDHLFKDSKQNIWIATQAGLFVTDEKTRIVKKVHGFEKYISAAQQFNYILELNNGKILLSSNAGIFFIKKDNNDFVISEAKGVSKLDVYSTNFQTANGDIYLCKVFKGFGVYRLQNDSFVLKKDFYNQATIKCYADANDSVLWIGTTKGLLKFNKNTLTISKTYKTTDGLPNHYIYSVLLQNDDLWITSNGGISKFTLSENIFKNFSVKDGLQSNEFNTYSFCKTSNGEFLFGGVNGINSFYPGKIKKYLDTPNIVLQKLFINDTIAKLFYNPEGLKKMVLPYEENTLSFQFAVLDYTNPNGCRILYKLEGYDRDWVSIKNKSFIRYTNLPPDEYTLFVKAVNAEGIESKDVFKIALRIKTPWNKSWWFKLLVIILTGFLIWFIIRSYYLRKLEKEKAALDKQHAIEQERTRLARELHDGLGSMLSGIKHSFSAIKNNVSLDEKQAINFDRSIEKLNTSIKEIRNISHSMMDSDSLLRDGLINALKDYCRNINNPSTFVVIFEAIAVDNLLLKEEQAFHILRITQELIQNIIKHAKASKVIVQIHSNLGKLHLTVEDNGVGFDSTKINMKKGIGFKNIQARLKITHGLIDVQSIIGKGTSIYIQCPIDLST
jgi:signal transduction histidine kinase/ligand-binding sensor domain-containing protein